MQVADIISWSLGRFACFHKREVALCVCVSVCVCVSGREKEREKRETTKSILTVCGFRQIKGFYRDIIRVYD